MQIDRKAAAHMQNIPVRTAEGAALQAAFATQPVELPVDYTQLELRMLAHVAATTGASYRCWLAYDMSEEHGIIIEGLMDADDAAQEACEKWLSGGTFAGDPIPNPIEVSVRDQGTNTLYLVNVHVEWEPVFYAGFATLVKEESST